MRWIWTFLWLFCLPEVAFGQTVKVRSGEHNGFTRIALDLPGRVPWQVVEGDTLQLKLEGLAPNFEVSSVMAKLNAGRVINVRQSDTGAALEIVTNCDCETRTYFASSRMLVLDIFGAPRPFGAVQAELDVDSPADAPAQSSVATGSFRLPVVTGERAVVPLPATVRRKMAPDSIVLSETTVARAERSRVLERKLLDRLGRVASQGLVEPHLRAQPTETATLTAKEPAPPPEDKPEFAPEEEGQNMRAFSSIDRDVFLSQGARAYNDDGQKCMSDSELDVHSWTGPEGFGVHIGSLRTALYGEFDAPKTDKAIELAQAYIGYGLGTEAMQVLRELGAADAPASLLVLADIVEDGERKLPIPPTWQPDCDSAAALWALLAGSEITASKPLNDAAVMRSFSALPTSLRAHLAPFLTSRLQAVGKENLLKDVARHTERGQPDGLQNVAMVDAQADVTAGDAGDALKSLDAVVRANGERAPAALVQKIDLQIQAGQEVKAADADLAEAFAREYRGEPIGAELERAALFARVASGGYRGSLAQLGELAPRLEEAQKKQAASYVLGEVSRDATDLDFLETAFSPEAENLVFKPEIEHLAARRLIDLGFSERAFVFLSSAARGELGRSRKILRAEAALRNGKVRQAEAELLGLHGEDVDAIRVKAKIGLQDHFEARLALEALGQSERAAEQAWLDEDWDALAGTGAPEWATERALVETTELAETGEMLSDSKALLDDASELKELVNAVLARHELTNFGDAQ